MTECQKCGDSIEVEARWCDPCASDIIDADGEPLLDPCQMCLVEEATTRWGTRVCEACADNLDHLDGVLTEMESKDPKLKTIGDRLRKATKPQSDYACPGGGNDGGGPCPVHVAGCDAKDG